MPKIIHQREDCIGCNSCVEYACAFWQMKEDGKSELIGGKKKGSVFVREVSEIEVEENVMAAISCPVGIIRVVDDKGNKLV